MMPAKLSVGVALLAGAATAQLALDGVRCGQLTCKPGEYCSQDSDRCAPCNVICNKTNNNFDSGLCLKECQGYIHDLRYVSRSDGLATSADIKSVQLQARLALIISCLVLALMLLLTLFKCISFIRSHRGQFTWKSITKMFQAKKNRVKQYPTDLTQHNPHAPDAAKPKHELKLEIRNPEPPKRHQPLNARDLIDNRNSHTERSTTGATTPKTFSTNLSNRHPAEDTTLDYSYDNMGMNVTPPPVQASASHNF